MSRIKIKNFGPIREGFVDNDGWLDIEKVTVFIGNQASGKSTVAKLVSVFSWLEKNIVRNNISVDQLNEAVFKKQCYRQELDEYFSPNTLLKYEGDACDFEYKGKEHSFILKINVNKYENYVLPKIQYVSAARNLLTILYNISLQNIVDNKGNIIDMASNIPFMVRELNNEYLKALSELAQNGFPLPISDTSVYFQNYSTFIVTKGTKVSMSAASSGIQSITPLLLVSYYLSKEVQKDLFVKVQSIDNNLKNKIANELRKKNEKWAEKFNQYCSFGKEVLSEDEVFVIEQTMKNFISSSFINIVEEPEQNLFPTSQQKVINSLLEYNNALDSNKLIITTHSPYIIGYMTLAVKAMELYKKAKKEEVRAQINEIVPQKSAISYDDLVIYELDEKDGSIHKLDTYKGIPSSKNYLNSELSEKNELYAQLLDIEDLCR